MPKGNPGQPKTAEHRAAISAGVRMHYESARNHLDYAIKRLEDSEKMTAQVDFEKLIGDLTWALSAILKGSASKQQLQSAEIANLRRQLVERGKAIEVMDVGALSRAKSTGLLPAEAVEAEYRRRTEVGLFGGGLSVQRVTGNGTTGAVLSGWMMCAAGCGTAVDLAERPDGYHKACAPKAPRRYISANFSAVDVDENLRDAEAEHKRFAEQLQAAEERLQSARQAVEAYDRQRAAANEQTPDDAA